MKEISDMRLFSGHAEKVCLSSSQNTSPPAEMALSPGSAWEVIYCLETLCGTREAAAALVNVSKNIWGNIRWICG
ncbi:hypothetical protein GCM10023188_40020 [Pontibacter saemangeumensis]|uniref:Uncharacterized protein n=1 Tax=Pontibacter saemangeumensis TaxID=1084525 RepID=A0ABP8M1S8_9BACT